MDVSGQVAGEFLDTSLTLVGSRLGSVVGAAVLELGVDQFRTSGKLLEERISEVIIPFDAAGGGDKVAGVVGEVEGGLGPQVVDEGFPVVGIVLV